jgi:hypothetical protein
MGASFTNYQIRGKSVPEVSEALSSLVESGAYVSPEKNGWVTVYDRSSDDQDEDRHKRVAAELSSTLNTAVFAFLVHDSDIAVYWLFRNGNLTDEFNSAPDYFAKVGEEVKSCVRGDTEKLLPLCVAGTSRAQVEEVIHPADGFAPFAEQILTDLSKLLGIDDARMTLGFEYFDQEGEDILPDASKFKPIGKGISKKKAQPPKPANQPPPVVFDPFPIAIGMMTRCWTGELEKMAEALKQRFPNQIVNIADQMSDGSDRVAQNFLKNTSLPDAPTFKELKAARDQGPEAFAKLLVQRAPTQLGSIADGAIQAGLVTFITALLTNGMDANTPNQHGQTLLSVAERLEKPEICEVLKSEMKKKS